MSNQHNENLEKWIQIAIKQQNLSDYRIEVKGQTDKGDGYSGNINFVKVTGTTQDGQPKTLDLALKSANTDEQLRQKILLKDVYNKEIGIYEKVKPTFEEFLRENGIEETIDFMPHCYGTAVTETSEVLIFENLRTKGFKLWDRTRPMTVNHAKLVLEAYGKWHALSMALKIRKPQVFQDLTRDNINMFSCVLAKMNLDVSFTKEFETNINTLIGAHEKDTFRHLQYTSSDVKYAFTDMYFEEPEYHVILHGDCWSSNYLFKSLDDETKPSETRILDWQCSGLGSVAFDISHFIYCCLDNGQYPDVKEMLKIYYKAFSKYLVLLGCDPETVFPFDKLLEHWRKFSRFGLFVSSWVVRVSMMEQDEVPDFANATTENAGFEVSNDDAYLKRIRNNFVHYVKNVQ